MGAAEQPAEQVDTTEPQPTTSASPAPTEPAAAPAAPTSTLYSIPVAVEITGAYDDVLAALYEFQTADARLILVTTVTLTPSDLVVATEGDTTAQFGGETFVLTSSQLEEAPVSDGSDAEGSSPSPSPQP